MQGGPTKRYFEALLVPRRVDDDLVKIRIKNDRTKSPPDRDESTVLTPLSASCDVHGHNQCSPPRETATCDSHQPTRFKLYWRLDKRAGTTTTLFHRVTSRR